MTARPIRALLWDFGDTLADERWMLAPMNGVPGWPAAYERIVGGDDLADRWNLGLTTAARVADELSSGLGVTGGRVLAHMRECCGNVTFYPEVMRLVGESGLPQAIVTINPDIFSDVVVPRHGLTARFTTIVTSWEEGTLSKADLCDIALSRLGGDLSRDESLLIDNKAANVAEWVARGGAGYLFTGAARLLSHLNSGTLEIIL